MNPNRSETGVRVLQLNDLDKKNQIRPFIPSLLQDFGLRVCFIASDVTVIVTCCILRAYCIFVFVCVCVFFCLFSCIQDEKGLI